MHLSILKSQHCIIRFSYIYWCWCTHICSIRTLDNHKMGWTYFKRFVFLYTLSTRLISTCSQHLFGHLSIIKIHTLQAKTINKILLWQTKWKYLMISNQPGVKMMESIKSIHMIKTYRIMSSRPSLTYHPVHQFTNTASQQNKLLTVRTHWRSYNLMKVLHFIH